MTLSSDQHVWRVENGTRYLDLPGAASEVNGGVRPLAAGGDVIGWPILEQPNLEQQDPWHGMAWMDAGEKSLARNLEASMIGPVRRVQPVCGSPLSATV